MKYYLTKFKGSPTWLDIADDKGNIKKSYRLGYGIEKCKVTEEKPLTVEMPLWFRIEKTAKEIDKKTALMYILGKSDVE